MPAWLDHLLGNLSSLPWIVQFLTISTASGLTEEIAVIGVVALARAGHLDWWIAISAMVVGTTVANMVVWWMGNAAGERALRWRVFSGIGEDRLERVRHQVRSKGWLAVFAARLVPGTRVGVFLLAGILGMNGWVFFATLAAGTVIWILSLLGLIQALGGLAQNHPWLAVASVALLVFLGVRVVRRRRTGDAEPSI